MATSVPALSTSLQVLRSWCPFLAAQKTGAETVPAAGSGLHLLRWKWTAGLGALPERRTDEVAGPLLGTIRRRRLGGAAETVRARMLGQSGRVPGGQGPERNPELPPPLPPLWTWTRFGAPVRRAQKWWRCWRANDLRKVWRADLTRGRFGGQVRDVRHMQ